MAQWLRVLGVLLEDLARLVSRTRVVVHTMSNSISRGSDSLSWPPHTPVTHVVYRHTGRQAPIHVK